MSRATIEEIFAAYVAEYGQRRVRRSGAVTFVGQPGHYYFVPRALNNRELARLTSRSGSAEVTLTRVNSAHIVHIGNRGVATATLTVPRRGDGIEEFRWIAHTHPLEQEDNYQMIARGPTAQDRLVLRRVYEQWEQTESTVVVCRGGGIERVVQFRL